MKTANRKQKINNIQCGHNSNVVSCYGSFQAQTVE